MKTSDSQLPEYFLSQASAAEVIQEKPFIVNHSPWRVWFAPQGLSKGLLKALGSRGGFSDVDGSSIGHDTIQKGRG